MFKRAPTLRTVRIIHLGLVFILGPLPCLAVPPNAPTIRSIRFESDGPILRLAPEELRKLVVLEEGAPFSEEAARRTVGRIYATDLFHDVQIETEPIGGSQVNVAVVLIRRYRVAGLRFDGRSSVSSRELQREITLAEGEPYSDRLLEQSLDRITGLYQRHGFYQTTVTPAYELEPESAGIRVEFRLEEGDQARVSELSVDLEGNESTEWVYDVIQTESGAPFSAVRLDEDLRRIRRRLSLDGYLNPEIYVREGIRYDSASNQVDLELRIIPRKRTEVVIEGIEFSESQLADLPLLASAQRGMAVIGETVRVIKRQLQNDGFFLAQVESEIEGNEFPPDRVLIRVDRGRKYDLSSIEFTGNQALSDAQLSRVVTTQKAGLIARGRLTEESIETDRERIQFLYQQRGYQDAAVEVDLREQSEDLSVIYRIEEGEIYLVGDVRFEGNESIPTEELQRAAGIKPGDTFSPFLATSGRNEVLSYYDQRGFRDIQVDPRLQGREAEERVVDIVFEIREGQRFLVENVVVGGNRITRQETIAKQILVEPGAPLSLERNLRSESNLYDLGVFSRVRVKEVSGRRPDQERLVYFSVEEARRYSLFYGIGYSHSYGSAASEGPRGTFGISDSNFLGRARTLSLSLRAGSRRQRGSLSYDIPRLWGGGIPTIVSLTVDNEKRISDLDSASFRVRGRPYDSLRGILSSQSELILSRRESIFLRYQFEYSRLKVPSKLENPLQFFREQERLRLSTFSLSYLNESRDSPADPSKGFFLDGDASVSAAAIGSGEQFFRLFTQGRYYYSPYTDLTLVAALRIGIIEPFGSARAETDNPVPISERFFAGGPTTLRGLPIDLAGPLLRDENGNIFPARTNCDNPEAEDLDEAGCDISAIPIGGNALIIGNLEMRFPLIGIFGGVLFLDSGNVFESISRLGRGNFSNAIGAGLSIRTPIGPVRLDLAYNPSPIDYEGFPRWNFHINIGHPF